MATLTNPVTAQNIVDRFADYVVATANGSIVWHSTNLPFPEFDSGLLSTATRAISVNGASITPANGRITASNIYNTLVAETNRYTNIRNLKATRTVAAIGTGNATATAGVNFDQTRVAHFSGTTRQQNIGTPANGGVAAGQRVDDANLETFFTTLQTAFTTARGNTVTINVDICHSSCHSSCHGSRGRR